MVLLACAFAHGQATSIELKPDPVARRILKHIDEAMAGTATNSPYLAAWNITKTNVHWTTEGKYIFDPALHYAHNIRRTGPLATNVAYGANACLIHISAPMKLIWSGLGTKTTLAGDIGNRDVLVSVQTWNPESPETEAAIRHVVQMAIANLKIKSETEPPNKASQAIGASAPQPER